MKRLLGVALLLLSGSVLADELADANRLLSEQAYAQALPIYRKLAAAGNPEAQVRLGEMVWFGDATPPNLDEAKVWFGKAAAAGNAEAAANLASLKRRETHADEIVYWTQVYDGADMVSGKFACKAPKIPYKSETKHQIKAVTRWMEVYSTCFNGFVENMRANVPSIKHIPVATLDMMTPTEVMRAKAHLDKLYIKIATDAMREAKDFMAQETVWWQKTASLAKQYNIRTETDNALQGNFGGLGDYLRGVYH